jgi:hypothetical protein
MMQDNPPINFYIKHFFINCQIKKLQPIFDTFVPPSIIRCLMPSGVVGGVLYTIYFTVPHVKKSIDVKSGERGGHATRPPRPIHRLGYFSSTTARATIAKCGGASSC